MSETILITGAGAVILLTATVLFVILFFLRRERRRTERIRTMLDQAIAGTLSDVPLDESDLSAIENSMWRYLCDQQVSRQQLAREKEQIQSRISDIAHQTGTPIANLILYAQLLDEWQERRGEEAEWTSAIREEAQKLDFLVDCLVKLSRLESGIICVHPREQRIQPVLTQIDRRFRETAGQKGIALEVETSQESAVMDLKWTLEAVSNVVDNGIKYTNEGGKVSVRVEPTSFFVRIRVADTGIGIPEEEQANVFTRFYRSQGVSAQPGLGIGLSLAREVMRAQDGYIKLSSRVGEGSVFSLYLPREKRSRN